MIKGECEGESVGKDGGMGKSGKKGREMPNKKFHLMPHHYKQKALVKKLNPSENKSRGIYREIPSFHEGQQQDSFTAIIN